MDRPDITLAHAAPFNVFSPPIWRCSRLHSLTTNLHGRIQQNGACDNVIVIIIIPHFFYYLINNKPLVYVYKVWGRLARNLALSPSILDSSRFYSRRTKRNEEAIRVERRL